MALTWPDQYFFLNVLVYKQGLTIDLFDNSKYYLKPTRGPDGFSPFELPAGDYYFRVVREEEERQVLNWDIIQYEFKISINEEWTTYEGILSLPSDVTFKYRSTSIDKTDESRLIMFF